MDVIIIGLLLILSCIAALCTAAYFDSSFSIKGKIAIFCIQLLIWSSFIWAIVSVYQYTFNPINTTVTYHQLMTNQGSVFFIKDGTIVEIFGPGRFCDLNKTEVQWSARAGGWQGGIYVTSGNKWELVKKSEVVEPENLGK